MAVLVTILTPVDQYVCVCLKMLVGVRRSSMSFAFMTILFVAWVILFQLKWEDFGWAKLVMVLPSKNLDSGW